MSETNPNYDLKQEQKPNSNHQSWYKSPMLLAWLFLVLAAMAGTIYMVIQANSGFPGLVVDDFYERGQDYEENIHKKFENNEKWATEFQLDEIYLNKPTIISITVSDKSGVAANPEKVTLYVYRPSNSKIDFNVPMTLSADTLLNGNPVYQATVIFEAKGKWDLLASINIDGVEVNYANNVFVKD